MRYVWASVLFLALGLAYLGMWRGWLRRGRRQAHLGPLALPPADPGNQLCRVEGVYLGTTTAGDWLDRVVAQRLGSRAEAAVAVTRRGVIIERAGGQQPWWIAAHQLDRVGLESAHAGKVLPGDGLVLVTWHHSEQGLDTGFAPRHSADREVLISAIRTLVKEAA